MSEIYSRILIVCATESEVPHLDTFMYNKVEIEVLVTGVGMVATTYALTRKLCLKEYDLVVNVGIAGTFQGSAAIGDVVQVVADRLVELGAEDHEAFIPANEMQLVDSEELIFNTDVRVLELPEVTGITVNRVHGNEYSISEVSRQFGPDVESMEGAAVAYVCSKFRLPWVQIRAISNLVEPRNKNNWNIPLAIKNLHQEVRVYLQNLNNEA